MVRPGELRGRGELLPQLLDAGPYLPQPGLDQAVGVQQQRRAGGRVQFHGLEVPPHADRDARGQPQHLSPAARCSRTGGGWPALAMVRDEVLLRLHSAVGLDEGQRLAWTCTCC